MSSRHYPNYLLNNNIYGVGGSGGFGSTSIGASYGNNGDGNNEDTRHDIPEETEEGERSQDTVEGGPATLKDEEALSRSNYAFGSGLGSGGHNIGSFGQDIFSRLPYGGWVCFSGYSKPWQREQE